MAVATGPYCPHCGERVSHAWRHQDPSRAWTCERCGGKAWLRAPYGITALAVLAGIAVNVWFLPYAALPYAARLATVLAVAVALCAVGAWIAWRHGTMIAVAGSRPVGDSTDPSSIPTE